MCKYLGVTIVDYEVPVENMYNETHVESVDNPVVTLNLRDKRGYEGLTYHKNKTCLRSDIPSILES
jgi:hypothetical protein